MAKDSPTNDCEKKNTMMATEQAGLCHEEELEAQFGAGLCDDGSAFAPHAEEVLQLSLQEVTRLGDGDGSQDEASQ